MCDPFGEATSIAFVGEIRVFSFGYVPKGWAASAGQVLPIQENTELFGLIGDTYGGDGQTTFRLPDLRGRVSGMSSTSAISAPVIRSRRRRRLPARGRRVSGADLSRRAASYVAPTGPREPGHERHHSLTTARKPPHPSSPHSRSNVAATTPLTCTSKAATS
jgi:hypothetical protein